MREFLELFKEKFLSLWIYVFFLHEWTQMLLNLHIHMLNLHIIWSALFYIVVANIIILFYLLLDPNRFCYQICAEKYDVKHATYIPEIQKKGHVFI